MAFWLMRWVWGKPSRPSPCSLTSPVRKVTNLVRIFSVLFLHTTLVYLDHLFGVLRIYLYIVAELRVFHVQLLIFCLLTCAGNWGPHLIIVPTSVMLNWEMELKRWCPGFKILTYFGSQKERKLKRQVQPSLHLVGLNQTIHFSVD